MLDLTLVLGQVKVDEKSNEITAIPKLLEILSLEGNAVTIDAMGCQTKIVEKIITEKANYIIAVKENQKTRYQEIEDEFRFSKDIHTASTQNLDHGRIETRVCSIMHQSKNLGSLLSLATKQIRNWI